MKKIILGTTILFCSVALVGCGKNAEKNNDKSEGSSSSRIEKSSSSLESSKKDKHEKTSESKEVGNKTSESVVKKKK